MFYLLVINTLSSFRKHNIRESKEDPKMLVLKRVPTLKNVDGWVIDESILEKLKSMAETGPTITTTK